MLRKSIMKLSLQAVILAGCLTGCQAPDREAARQSDHVPADARVSLKDYYYYVSTHMALAKQIPYSDSEAFGQCNADLLEDVVPPQAYMVLSRSVKDPPGQASGPDYKSAYQWVDTSRPDVAGRIQTAAKQDCPDVYARYHDLFLAQILPAPAP